MKASVTLIKGNEIGIETDYRDALPVNMFAVEKQILGAEGYMLQYDGLETFTTGEGTDRAGVYNDRFQKHYRLSGTQLIEIAIDGTTSNIGTILGSSQARLESFYSFNTQGIIADGRFYLCDATNEFWEVTDSALGEPIDGVWIDGYYFMTDGEYIFHTDIDDESSIDPLKFATAEFMPDESKGLSKSQDNKVMVWGRYTLEYFVNVATENFAFSRISTRAQKTGIVATHAKCEAQGVFYILGGRKDEVVSAHQVVLGTTESIATREVDKIISQYSEPELSDVRIESRTAKNTTFILFHLPNETLCYNKTVAQKFGLSVAWSQLKSVGYNYRAINGIFDARNAFWIYGDKEYTNIGKLDDITCTHYGKLVAWELYSPFLNLANFSIDEISIDTIPGHSTFTDGTVALSFTYNGVTYGTEVWLAYGEPGKYSHQFIARRLGYVSNWVGIKLRGISKTKMAFALMEVTYS